VIGTAHIPLLAEEGKRDSLIEAGAPEWSARRQSIRRSDHYYGFALSRSRFAPVCAYGAATPLRGGEYMAPTIR